MNNGFSSTSPGEQDLLTKIQDITKNNKINKIDNIDDMPTLTDSPYISKTSKKPSIFDRLNIFKSMTKEENNKTKYSILILIFAIVFLVLYLIGLYKLLTTKKYKHLEDSETNKYIIYLNLFLSYVQIISILILIFYNRSEILKNFKNNNIFRYGLVILVFIYFFFFLSILRFTYILQNMEDYSEKDFCFFTNYYIFMQFIPFILFFVYIFKYKDSYISVEK